MTTQKAQLSGRRIDRRRFLKTAALAGAGTALAACVPPTAAPGAAPAAAPAVNKGVKQTVRYLSWWFPAKGCRIFERPGL